MTHKLPTKLMYILAKKRGGVCLSTKYKNVEEKLKWKCSNGHIFFMPLKLVKGRYRWCPQCKNFIGESLTRRIFESLFNKKFNKQKLNWLKTRNQNHIMELDGYNKKLKIGFEYNGVQHYKLMGKYVNNDEFLKTQKKDKLKNKLCKKHGVLLITIPYWIEYNNIKNYIVKVCDKYNIFIPNRDRRINIKNLYMYNNNLKNINIIVRKKQGICLSKSFLGFNQKLKFKCKNNHIWESLPQPIINGHWCPYCFGNNKKTIVDAKQLAKQKDLKCISTKSMRGINKYLWKCKNNHIWKTTYARIKGNYGCPVCNGGVSKQRIENILNGCESREGIINGT